MPYRHPPEFRRRVLDLLAAGRSVALPRRGRSVRRAVDGLLYSVRWCLCLVGGIRLLILFCVLLMRSRIGFGVWTSRVGFWRVFLGGWVGVIRCWLVRRRRIRSWVFSRRCWSWVFGGVMIWWGRFVMRCLSGVPVGMGV